MRSSGRGGVFCSGYWAVTVPTVVANSVPCTPTPAWGLQVIFTVVGPEATAISAIIGIVAAEPAASSEALLKLLGWCKVAVPPLSVGKQTIELNDPVPLSALTAPESE